MIVLVVEDDPAQRLLLRRVLEDLSMQVWEASTIQEARETPKPDLILIDWRLPDGTARDLQVGVPIVALSGYDRPPDGKPWSGYWVRKPLHLDELRDIITQAIGMAGT